MEVFDECICHFEDVDYVENTLKNVGNSHASFARFNSSLFWVRTFVDWVSYHRQFTGVSKAKVCCCCCCYYCCVCVCGGGGGAGGLCVYVCVGKILWPPSSNILEAMVTLLCWTLDRTSVLDGYLLFYQINNSFSFIELG